MYVVDRTYGGVYYEVREVQNQYKLQDRYPNYACAREAMEEHNAKVSELGIAPSDMHVVRVTWKTYWGLRNRFIKGTTIEEVVTSD